MWQPGDVHAMRNGKRARAYVTTVRLLFTCSSSSYFFEVLPGV